jgi:hypothetical protein
VAKGPEAYGIYMTPRGKHAVNVHLGDDVGTYRTSGAEARACQVIAETPPEVFALGLELLSEEDETVFLRALERGEF